MRDVGLALRGLWTARPNLPHVAYHAHSAHGVRGHDTYPVCYTSGPDLPRGDNNGLRFATTRGDPGLLNPRGICLRAKSFPFTDPLLTPGVGSIAKQQAPASYVSSSHSGGLRKDCAAADPADRGRDAQWGLYTRAVVRW